MADVTSTTGSKRLRLQQSSENARQVLSAPRMLKSQVLQATSRLMSAWPFPKDDEYVDSIIEVLEHFPASIVQEAVDPWSGIAASSPKGPPSTGALKAWCYAREDHYRRCSEIEAPIEPARPAPAPEDVARVQAKLREATASLTRAMGRHSAEDQRAEAERLLARHLVEANSRPPASRETPAPFDDPDLG
jgi:hypothetical protein